MLYSHIDKTNLLGNTSIFVYGILIVLMSVSSRSRVIINTSQFLVLRRLNLEIQGLPESYMTEPDAMADNVGADAHHPPLPPPPPPTHQQGRPSPQHGPQGGGGAPPGAGTPGGAGSGPPALAPGGGPDTGPIQQPAPQHPGMLSHPANGPPPPPEGMSAPSGGVGGPPPPPPPSSSPPVSVAVGPGPDGVVGTGGAPPGPPVGAEAK
mmetsp:Transcript_1363/g.3786  ORF Transcript_1363/g.3786 Transcript_1363/m.3786 type:complete len:208 (+) Transcript_1363:1369-1992(+)